MPGNYSIRELPEGCEKSMLIAKTMFAATPKCALLLPCIPSAEGAEPHNHLGDFSGFVSPGKDPLMAELWEGAALLQF